MIPERRNKVKLLLFLDIGGSMDAHIRVCEELFSAARGEFKHLEYLLLPQLPLRKLWKDNRRRHADTLSDRGPDPHLCARLQADLRRRRLDEPLRDRLSRRLGRALERGGGQVWIQRLLRDLRRSIWLNPAPQNYWSYTESTRILQRLMEGRMYPLTLDGLDAGMKELSR